MMIWVLSKPLIILRMQLKRSWVLIRNSDCINTLKEWDSSWFIQKTRCS